MIDTENVTCDTCTAPSEFVFDASDEQSRGWPRLDIRPEPVQGRLPLLSERDDLGVPRQRRHRPAPRMRYSRLKSASTRL